MVADGTTRYPGGRQAWCPSSPVFRAVRPGAGRRGRRALREPPRRRAVARLERARLPQRALLLRRERERPSARWLRERYGSIAALNAAWGTSFWSQRYTEWDEIGTPRLTLSTRNPSQMLDFSRFSSDELLELLPGRARTSSAGTARRPSRRTSWSPPTSASWTTGPGRPRSTSSPTTTTSTTDSTTRPPSWRSRPTSPGASPPAQPWMLMEHSTGSVNWQPHNLAKAPGQMTRDSLQHVARGADSVCFFQWRASLQGSEKFHSALLPHAGTDSALWREALELGALLDRIGGGRRHTRRRRRRAPLQLGGVVGGRRENRPSESVSYLDQVWALHRALRESGASVDVVRPGADLSGYRLVVVPGLHLVRDRDAQTLDAAVAAGAHALVTFYSGIVDECDRVRPGGHPAVLARPSRHPCGGIRACAARRDRHARVRYAGVALDRAAGRARRRGARPLRGRTGGRAPGR